MADSSGTLVNPDELSEPSDELLLQQKLLDQKQITTSHPDQAVDLSGFEKRCSLNEESSQEKGTDSTPQTWEQYIEQDEDLRWGLSGTTCPPRLRDTVRRLMRERTTLEERCHLNETLSEKMVDSIRQLTDRVKQLEQRLHRAAARSKRGGAVSGDLQQQQPSTSAVHHSVENEEDEVDRTYKQIDDAFAVLSHEMIVIQSTMDAHKMQNAREKDIHEKKFLDLQLRIMERKQRMNQNGKLVWRIADFHSVRAEQASAVESDKMSIISPHFQTPSGYEFRLRAFLDGTGKGKGTHVSMFIQMCRTDLDDIMEYPFNAVIVFKVMDQSGNSTTSSSDTNSSHQPQHHKLMFRTNNSPCFKRPTQDYTPENGLAQLISHEVLFKSSGEGGSGGTSSPVYISSDNVIFLAAEILKP